MSDLPELPNASRMAFEAWATEHRYRPVMDKTYGVYMSSKANHAWCGWQASRKQALEEARDLITGIAESNELVSNTQGIQAADDCLIAIEGLMK